MNENTVLSKEFLKECLRKNCSLKDKFPDGAPAYFESCPICQSSLSPIRNMTKFPHSIKTSTPCDVTFETAERSPEEFITTGQSSSLKVIFRTIMVETHFTSISGKLTIMFEGVILGNLDEDTACVKKIGNFEYHDVLYVILEGFILIPDVIFGMLHQRGSFGIPYKYFLNGKVEILENLKMYRCLYLRSKNMVDILYKYDFMPLPGNLSDEYMFLRKENMWMIMSFLVFANFTHKENFFTFEEQVATMTEISKSIFHSRLIFHSKVGDGIVLPKNCLHDPNSLGLEIYSVTQWIGSKIRKSQCPENFLRYLIFSLLFAYNGGLNEGYHTFFKRFLRMSTLDHIMLIISNKYLFFENFQDKIRTIKNLRESFEAIIFNGPNLVTNELIVLQFLPLYHCLFKHFDLHNSPQNQQAILDNEYWGFPTKTDTLRFYNCHDVEKLTVLLHMMNQHYPIFSYTIVLISINEENFQKFSSNHSITIPLLPSIVYRMETWPIDHTPMGLRNQIFSYLINNLSNLAHNISETDLHVMCEAIFYLWDISKELPEAENGLLHLALTAAILKQIEPYHRGNDKSFTVKTKHFKSSKQLMDIFINRFQILFSIQATSTIVGMVHQLDLWEALFLSEFPVAYDWQSVVENQFSRVIRNLSGHIIAQIFVNLSESRKFGTKIYFLLKYHLIQLLNENQDQSFQTDILLQLVNISISMELVEILNVLYTQKYISFEENRTLHVLSWSPWEILFRFSLHEIQSNQHDIIELLKFAKDEYMNIIHSLMLSRIKLKYLRIIHREKFLSMFNTMDMNVIMSGEKLTRDHVEVAIEIALRKMDFFDEQTKRIHNFKNILSSATHLLESQEIKDFLMIDSDSQQLYEVCSNRDSSDRYQILPNSILATHLNSDIVRVMLTASLELRNSCIFSKIFQNLVLSKYNFNQNKILEIKEIYSNLWHPAYLCFETLIQALFSRVISLSSVEKHFNSFREAEENIRSEIRCISEAMNIVGGYDTTSVEDINKAARVIMNYFKFQESTDLALTIHRVHLQYCREGDFSKSNTLANLANSQFIENNNLKIITEDLGAVHLQLHKYNHFHKSLLETYIFHPAFIIWVRDTLKDRQQVKVFVDLALTSCEESDFNISRITCLRSVCNNLAPLIFDVHPKCSYNEFMIIFNNVIEQIVDLEQFLKTFSEASNLLHIWKRLELTHSSVGKSTIQELTDILKVGYFKVNHENESSDDCIHLFIRDSTISRTYNLENLRDLQSKIALIKAESKATQDIDLFSTIFERVVELSSIVGKLKKLGHIVYVNYIKEFPCDNTVLMILSSEIAIGNTELNTWSNTLDEARQIFYSLNIYTNIQIFILRRDLKLFQTQDIFNPQIIHLLSMAYPKITKECILKGLDSICDSMITTQTGSRPIVEVVDNDVPDCEDSIEQFPNTFSEDDKQMCQSLFQDQDIDITLTIVGIQQFKRDLETYTELDLLTFCLNNESLMVVGNDELEVDITNQIVSNIDDPLDILTQQSNENHLSLKSLSLFLEEIKMEYRNVTRQIPNTCKLGQPNLLFVTNNEMLYFVLSQYLSCQDVQSFPSSQEILLCTNDTNVEEIDIFFRRVVWDRTSNFLFCLVYIEKLKYEIAVTSITLLNNYMSSVNNPNFKLLLLCSAESENISYFASTMYRYRRVTPISFEDSLLKDTLLERYSYQENVMLNNQTYVQQADFIHTEMSKVLIVTSNSVGAGKSLVIKDLGNQLKQMQNLDDDCSTTIPLQGGNVLESDIVKCLLAFPISNREYSCLFHFDVSSTIMEEIIPFLFKLLIVGTLQDRIGNVWSCRDVDYYVVEITLPSEHPLLSRFCNLFPLTLCLQPKQALEKMSENTLPSEKTLNEKEFISSDYQRVITYLHKKERKQSFEGFCYSIGDKIFDSPIQFLEITLKYSGLINPSWSELNNFIRYLSQQLLSCERNIYCQQSLSVDEWKGFRTFLINMIIPMSRDIVLPSLSNSLENFDHDILSGYSIKLQRKWEQKSQPYLYFNEDRQSMTFLGVQVSKNQNLMDPLKPSSILEKKVISKDLYDTLIRNRVDLQDDCITWDKAKKISVLANVMGIIQNSGELGKLVVTDPDSSYVLTIDNLKKILAIHMRFRCNIPVIIMGETGCGKTRLVYYMCQLQSQHIQRNNMRILKMHGGTTDQDIIEELNASIKLAQKNVLYNIDTVLFFDEANTSHSIELIKEILCDRRVNGSPIPGNIRLQFVAACNPYRRRSKEMLNKLMTAGLGKISTQENDSEHFGEIPLRELVYRVVELPKSLLPLVWDFGQLSREVEESYIREIINGHLGNSAIKLFPQLLQRITEILSITQQYMRGRIDECSFVSLRDVERTMKVMLWFYEHIPIFVSHCVLDRITTSLLLSLSVCYRARLKYRKSYDKNLVDAFKPPLSKLTDEYMIIDEIEKFQSVIADNMKIGEYIAKNSSLKENLFMMFVCIELRIPLFIIGKPGSSKSLAKAIINNSMEGDGARLDSKLKHFKRVDMLSYQCSQLSTSEGILNLFKTCRIIQSREDPEKFVSCVVLEEVGLAEDSPRLPLKILHPLLEDDSAFLGKVNPELSVGNNGPRIAFIGLSNWSLDPAKMNRGIMVCLEDPYKEELVLSAKAICQSNKIDIVAASYIIPFIQALVNAYLQLTKIQEKNIDIEYFGLRDFYSLIKMLYHICRKENTPLNRKILRHAVERNFGGLIGINSFEIFQQWVYLDYNEDRGPGYSPFELIEANLISHQGPFYSRNRYLLLLTENYAALDIIQQTQLIDKNDSRIIFGSSFPNDSQYSTICRNINLIKSYIETGRTLILTNLLNLYESLYDVLNQYYFESLGKYWVDIGLGTHRVKCSVHENFRLIIIADSKTVCKHFPSALINRFEKHLLTVSSVLSPEEKEIAFTLSIWANNFITMDLGSYIQRMHTIGDCFVGFQEDTAFMMIYSLLRKFTASKSLSLGNISILEKAKISLLMMSTPDSILRLSRTKLRSEANSILNLYLTLPLQDLKHYFQHIIENDNQFSFVTTHSMLLSESEFLNIENSFARTSISLQVIYLLQFQTNQQFSNRIQEILNTHTMNEEFTIVLVQCEDGNMHSDLIYCARHHIMEQVEKINERKSKNIFFVIIVRMARRGNSFSSYCGGVWDTVHIDELRPPELTILPCFTDLIHLSLSDIFSGRTKVNVYSRTYEKWISEIQTPP